MSKVIIGLVVIALGAWFWLGGDKDAENVTKQTVGTISDATDKLAQDAKDITKEVADKAGSEVGNLAYIALGNANKVGLIDVSKKVLVKTLPASNNPHGVAVANGYIFTSSTKMGPTEMAMVPEEVPSMPGMDAATMAVHHPPTTDAAGQVKKVGGDTIAVVSQETGKVVKEINVGGGSHHLASSNDGTKVAVIVPSKNGVVIIDTSKLEEISFFETGKVSNYATFSADDTKLFVSNSAGNTLSVIELATKKIVNIAIKSLPDHIVIGKAGKFVYTANGASNSVGVVDVVAGKVVTNIPVGKVPHGIAIAIDGAKLYVANSKSDTVSVIDIEQNKVIKTIEFPAEIAHLEISPSTNELWVNSEKSKAIFVMDAATSKITSKIDLGEEPHQIVF